MSMSDNTHINYSELLAELINDDKLNDIIVSFLYHLFPNELFIRAFSLLESNDMFIYVFEDTSSIDTIKSIKSSTSNEEDELCELVNKFYDPDSESLFIYRLIVRETNNLEEDKPIYVDLNHWFCSCEEYSQNFTDGLFSPDDLSCQFTKELDQHTSDRFAKWLKYPQRFWNHEKLICIHLLAFGILLQTSVKVLRYFTITKLQVFLIRIHSSDEWLKLHLNIITK